MSDTPFNLSRLAAPQVEAFVRERYGPGAGDVEAFEQGEWSRAFAFRHDGRDRVIRFSALDEDFAKDRFAHRWRSPALPIPQVLELGPAFGGYFAVSERLYGGFIDDLDAAGMQAMLPALFETLDALRLADLAGTSGYGLWDANGDAPHQSWPAFLLDVGVDRPEQRIGGWRAALEASAVGTAPFDEAYERLRVLAPLCPDVRHLIHSDLLHFNVLVEDARITGLLDWGCGLYGDFLYDIAWFTFWSAWEPAWRAVDFRGEAARHFERRGVAVPNFGERLRACEIQIGLDGMAYQAFKGFRSDLQWTAARTLDIVNSPL